MTYRIMVIGSGGREAALVWTLARTREQSKREIDVVPGNPGTEWPSHSGQDGWHYAKAINESISLNNLEALRDAAVETDLVVVGPEVPLAAGIADVFQVNEDGPIAVFGPSKAAAQLEGSKAFSKTFMRENGIPTADFAVFDDYESACDYVTENNRQFVVKADGLAAGKGVIVCDTTDQARAALHTIMIQKAFGASGERVVIEERLDGWEVSVLAFVDGKNFAIMPYAADHKRAYDGDQGPNTGGMGAYAPRAIDYPNFEQIIIDQVLRPTIDGMAKRGTPYKGVLYAGIMITADGPQVLEYNCRFGDPEAQVILPLLETPLADILNACIDGTLDQLEIRWRDAYCATVVLASGGYPGDYPTGLPIQIDTPLPEHIMVFHAGTARRDDQLVTAGGRVLNVTALADTLPEALDRAYTAVDHIHFEGMHYRKDIGRTIREAAK